jgi:hypothetical protein
MRQVGEIGKKQDNRAVTLLTAHATIPLMNPIDDLLALATSTRRFLYSARAHKDDDERDYWFERGLDRFELLYQRISELCEGMAAAEGGVS